MKEKRGSLIVVSSKKQVKQAFKFVNGSDAIILALNLQTEYYLKSVLKSYINPVYSLIKKDFLSSQRKYILNFPITGIRMFQIKKHF